MACTIINTPSVGASDWTNFITQVEKQRKGYLAVSLTNYDTIDASNIASGSVMELSGSFYTFSDTAISLAAGTPSAAQAVYFTVIPAAGGTTCTVVMEGTAPTWVDGKQGWYASAASLTRYIGTCDIGTAGVYYNKNIYLGRYRERPMQIETKIKEDATTGLSASTVTDVDVTGFSFTPTAVMDVNITAWSSALTEGGAGNDDEFYFHSLFGSPPRKSNEAGAADISAYIHIIKATPGANKVTVRVANYINIKYYRITCTAARGG